MFIDLFSHSLFIGVFSSVAIFRSSSPEQREQSENIVEAHAFLLRSNNNDDDRKQIQNKKGKRKKTGRRSGIEEKMLKWEIKMPRLMLDRADFWRMAKIGERCCRVRARRTRDVAKQQITALLIAT